jgi:hypothetical protein
MPINFLDLEKFLKDNSYSDDRVHFIFAGAVVSGILVIDSRTSETISVRDAITYTGLSVVGIETVIIPFDHILAWGEGEIEPRP